MEYITDAELTTCKLDLLLGFGPQSVPGAVWWTGHITRQSPHGRYVERLSHGWSYGVLLNCWNKLIHIIWGKTKIFAYVKQQRLLSHTWPFGLTDTLNISYKAIHSSYKALWRQLSGRVLPGPLFCARISFLNCNWWPEFRDGYTDNWLSKVVYWSQTLKITSHCSVLLY